MAVTHPWPPWTAIAVGLALATTSGLAARFAIDRGRSLGKRLGTRAMVFAASLIAAWALAGAAADPRWVSATPASGAHVVVALDVSRSLVRGPDDLARLRQFVRDRLARLLTDAPPDATGSFLVFAENVIVVKDGVALATLPDAVAALGEDDLPASDGTDVMRALEAAGRLIARAGRRGVVLLLTDGNETQGDALLAARRLAERGIAVDVVPRSAAAEIGLDVAYLPRRTTSGLGTFARARLANRSTAPADVQVDLLMNDGLTGEPRADHRLAARLEPGALGRVREPLAFTGFGIQFVDFAVRDGATERHRQRVFTAVRRPPHVLVVGGDTSWTSAVDPDAMTVTCGGPDRLADPAALTDVDAVVVSGVPASQLPPSAVSTLATAVQRDGLGLFVVNGGHPGDVEAETVLGSYADTPLGPILPLRPRPRSPGPAPRRIVIVIDTSGSMCTSMGGANRLGYAVSAATAIVEGHLRPEDRLWLFTFDVGFTEVLHDLSMDDAGKATATRLLSGLQCTGGTNPTAVLAALGRLRLPDCYLFFLSDGEFDAIAARPDCRTTALGIGSEGANAIAALRNLADPIVVGETFDPARLQIRQLEPRPPTRRFEPGPFSPVAVPSLEERNTLPVPAREMEGTAITVGQTDATVVAVRPKLADPVLAYRDERDATVGALATGFPGAWTAEGAAVTAWLRRVLPFTDPDRYTFDVHDGGGSLDITIALAARDGRVPRVSALAASLAFPDGPIVPVTLQRDAETPGTFRGRVDVPRGPSAGRARLVVTESGDDAFGRPERIPFVVPPAGPISAGHGGVESSSYGTNEPRLRSIVELTNGAWDPDRGTSLVPAVLPSAPERPLWPWLLVCAGFAHVTAVGIRRLDP